MVEFALILPFLLLVLALTIDFGRLVYTYTAISWAARAGARMIALVPQQASDCAALTRVVQVGQGFPISVDPNSVVNDTNPNAPSGPLQPTTPGPGQGYVYIWPAVAPSSPQLPSNCDGTPRYPIGQVSGQSLPHDVAVEVQYGYTPMVPLFQSFIPNITIKTISVVHTEY